MFLLVAYTLFLFDVSCLDNYVELVIFKSLVHMLSIFISTVLGSNNLKSADVPLSSKQTSI